MNENFLQSLRYVIREASGHLDYWDAWDKGSEHISRLERFVQRLESLEQEDLEEWAEGVWAGVEYTGNKQGAKRIQTGLTDLFGGA